MVIITDGLPAHKLAFNQIDLEKENIVVHYLEAHSSDQLQPLDLAIFGGTKRFLSNFKTIFGLSPAANQILKIYQALHQMFSQPNCRLHSNLQEWLSKFNLKMVKSLNKWDLMLKNASKSEDMNFHISKIWFKKDLN